MIDNSYVPQSWLSFRAKYQVSRGLGYHPVWSPDGKEIFYSSAPFQLAVVGISTLPSLKFTNAVLLAFRGVEGVVGGRRSFDVMRDGKTFITPQYGTEPGSATPQIDVVLNWFRELQERVPIH